MVKKQGLKIAFVTFEYPPDTGKGGIATYTQQIARLLASKNVEVHVFASSSKRGITEKDGGVFIHWVLSTDPFDFCNKVTERFKSIHSEIVFDIIESAEIHGNAWKIKENFPDIPLIVRLHAPNYIVEHLKKKYVPFFKKLRYVLGAVKQGRFDLGYWRRYEKEADPDYHFTLLADHITAPSTWMKEWACKNWKINTNQITVIANPFVPLEKLASIPICPHHKFRTIVFLGRLNVLKGLYNGTKAVKNILIKYPNWRFRVIGDDCSGPDTVGKSMKEWMKHEFGSLTGRVDFFDGINYHELPHYLSDCEIMIIPSLFESFSYVCIEGMVAGKAVVGSLQGGMRDLIEQNKTGLLVNPFSRKEIEQAIEMLINNPNKCFELGSNARQKILRENQNEEIAEQFLDLYRSVITK